VKGGKWKRGGERGFSWGLFCGLYLSSLASKTAACALLMLLANLGVASDALGKFYLINARKIGKYW
jgi:hypothetical protein